MSIWPRSKIPTVLGVSWRYISYEKKKFFWKISNKGPSCKNRSKMAPPIKVLNLLQIIDIFSFLDHWKSYLTNIIIVFRLFWALLQHILWFWYILLLKSEFIAINYELSSCVIMPSFLINQCPYAYRMVETLSLYISMVAYDVRIFY